MEMHMAKYVEATKQYLREVKVEMAKVVWPTWPELRGSTILVIILSAFFALYIGGVDLLLAIVTRLF